MQLKNIGWLSISVFIIIIDQWTKIYAMQHLVLWQPHVVIPDYFNWTLAYNQGASFGFLSHMGGWQRWLFSAIAIIVSAVLLKWLMQLPARHKWLATALSLIIGGALGNLIDRIRLQYVIDFIQVHYQHYYWPVFNVADCGVVTGACMLFIYLFFMQEKLS